MKINKNPETWNQEKETKAWKMDRGNRNKN